MHPHYWLPCYWLAIACVVLFRPYCSREWSRPQWTGSSYINLQSRLLLLQNKHRVTCDIKFVNHFKPMAPIFLQGVFSLERAPCLGFYLTSGLSRICVLPSRFGLASPWSLQHRSVLSVYLACFGCVVGLS